MDLVHEMRDDAWLQQEYRAPQQTASKVPPEYHAGIDPAGIDQVIEPVSPRYHVDISEKCSHLDFLNVYRIHHLGY